MSVVYPSANFTTGQDASKPLLDITGVKAPFILRNSNLLLRNTNGETLVAINADVNLADDSDMQLATQHAIKTYVDTMAPLSSLTVSTPLVRILNNVDIRNTASNTITEVSTDISLASDSDTKLATQHAVKTYVDTMAPLSGLTFSAPLYRLIDNIDLKNSAAATITEISTDGTMTSNSDTKLATQKAIVTYVGTTVAPADALVTGTAKFVDDEVGHTMKCQINSVDNWTSSVGALQTASTVRLTVLSTETYLGGDTGALCVFGDINGKKQLNCSGTVTSGGYLRSYSTFAGVQLSDSTLVSTADMVLEHATGNLVIKALPNTITTRFDNKMSINNATASTSPTTGALVVAGGIGSGNNIWVNNRLAFANISDKKKIYLLDVTGNDYQFYGIGNPSNTLQFQTPSVSQQFSFCCGTSPTTEQECFRIDTSLTGGVYVRHTTVSTSTTTGALVVNGGVGTADRITVGTDLYINSATGLVKFAQALARRKLILYDTVATPNAYQFYGMGVISNGPGGSLLLQAYAPYCDFSFRCGTSTTTEQECFRIDGNIATGSTRVLSATASTSPITGALLVSGGVGATGAIYSGSSINSAGVTPRLAMENTDPLGVPTNTYVIAQLANGSTTTTLRGTLIETEATTLTSFVNPTVTPHSEIISATVPMLTMQNTDILGVPNNIMLQELLATGTCRLTLLGTIIEYLTSTLVTYTIPIQVPALTVRSDTIPILTLQNDDPLGVPTNTYTMEQLATGAMRTTLRGSIIKYESSVLNTFVQPIQTPIATLITDVIPTLNMSNTDPLGVANNDYSLALHNNGALFVDQGGVTTRLETATHTSFNVLTSAPHLTVYNGILVNGFTCDADENIVLDKPRYADVQSFAVLRGGTADSATWEEITTTDMWAWKFASGQDRWLWGSAEVPHTWAAGTNIIPHIRICNGIVPSTGNSRWQMNYYLNIVGLPIIAGPATPIAVTYPVNSGVDSYHQFQLSLPAITATAAQKGATIIFKVGRDGNNVLDTSTDDLFMLTCDFHFQCDKLCGDAGGY